MNLKNVNFCPSLLGQKFFVRFFGELKKRNVLLKLTDLSSGDKIQIVPILFENTKKNLTGKYLYGKWAYFHTTVQQSMKASETEIPTILQKFQPHSLFIKWAKDKKKEYEWWPNIKSCNSIQSKNDFMNKFFVCLCVKVRPCRPAL